MYGNKNKTYNEYRNNTSLIWPLPPGMYQYVPDILKRTIFCEWDMFAFKTKAQRNKKKN